jgi:hypothetical protein
MFPQKLRSYIFPGLPSRVVESTILPTRMDLFLQWLDSAGSQSAATQIPVKPFSFKRLTLFRAAT